VFPIAFKAGYLFMKSWIFAAYGTYLTSLSKILF